MSDWKRLERRTIYSTPFIKVFEDTIQIGENGTVVNDYSTIEFKDSVVVVATDVEGRLILIREYKYAANKTFLGLPAGGVENGDDPITTASKELLEETGYVGDKGQIIKMVHTYPSKIQHNEYIVRITNAQKKADTQHEATESIDEVVLVEPSDVTVDLFDASYSIAALAACKLLV